ncbi:MAG: L,D-transpeptidase family protein [Desulfobacteraceae bacterium]
MRSSGTLPTGAKVNTGKRPNGAGGYLHLLFLFVMLTMFFSTGCSHSVEVPSDKSLFSAASDLFAQGDYAASLDKYEKLVENESEIEDRVLFEMGIVYAHPRNERKSYHKALECFRKIISDFPDSKYRHDSQMMVLQIQNVIIKDNLIAEQQTQIDSYRQGIKSQEAEITQMLKKIRTLEQKVFELRTEPVDKVLVEKKKRRLTLVSKGEAIKTYKIALGGNPIGPKERQGDYKTPEGIYTILSRNRHSDYHISLRISYPNKKDKQRAKKLGVSPGGDIMIHGIKNGHAWVGSFHAGIDWTKGCIAVTNQEMEEIVRLVPIGTTVEIRP